MKTRRLRLWLITSIATLIVVAATLSALFRTAVAVAPGYRQQLQEWVGRTLDHPARIGSMNLLWNGFQPVLELSNVELLSAPGGNAVVTASRLRIGFGLRDLLTGHILPSDLTLSGLQLGLQADADGQFHLLGFGAKPGQTDYEPVLQALARFNALHLDGCRLTVEDTRIDPAPLLFEITRVDLLRHEQTLQLRAALRPPPSLAQALSVDLTTQGLIEDPSQWQIDWSATATGLGTEAGWLLHLLHDGDRVVLRDGRLTVGGQWLKGQFASAQADFRATAVDARRGNRVLAHAGAVQITATAQHSGEVWTIALAPVQLTGIRGSWPTNHWRARLHAGDAGIDDVNLSGDYLRLDDLLGWLAVAKQPSQLLSTLSAVEGEVRDVSLQWSLPAAVGTDMPAQARPQPSYQLRARFGQLGLTPVGDHPGIAGLSGQLSASAAGGTVQFDPVPVTLTLPAALDAPVLVDALGGPLHWEHDPDGWHVSSAAVEFRLGGTQGNGHFDLRLPQIVERSPLLDLQLDFQSTDAAALKPLMPKNWSTNTKIWLRRAIVKAPITHGHLDVNGPLADFPFVERPSGHWSIDVNVSGAELAFAPEWMPLQNGKANVHIAGRRLDVRADSGTLGDITIDHAEAAIPDFAGPGLTVDGQGHGDTQQFYAVLRNSPLRTTLSGLLDRTEASGAAQATLHLDIPFGGKASDIGVHGTVGLDSVRFDVKGLDEPIMDVGGQLAFGTSGVTADALHARFYDLPLSARIVADPVSTQGRIAIDLDVPTAQPDRAGGGVMAHYVPDWVGSHLSGKAHWSASLPLSGKEAGALSLSSDLKGIDSALPAPFAKTADESLPITLRIAGDDAAPLRVLIGLPDAHCATVCIALRFAQAQSALKLRGIEGHFGADAVPQAAADGIVASGHPDTLDIAAWLGLFAGSGGAIGGDDLPSVRRIDVAAGSLAAGDYRLPATHLSLLPAVNAGSGWTLNVDGDGAKGAISWGPADGGQLHGNFERLRLEPLALPAPPAASAAPPAVDDASNRDVIEPAHAPTLDLQVDKVESAGVDLGHFRLVTSRITNGQSIDLLHLEGGVMTLDSRGSWRRASGRSSGDNKFTISSSDFGAALKALGYAPSITGHTAKVSGQLQWADSASGIDFRQAAGTVKLEVDNGSLTAVDPGAGRMLGLLNLYALPRRLTLNFSDVVAKGLGFDKLDGTFTLAGGNAMTDDMRIAAPSLRMEIHGRIGLVARDYDEHVTVYPGLSTGAVIGAGLAGGPAGVAIALVAQQLFKKPLDSLARFSYHLTGGWDNPQIKRGDSEPAVPAATPAAAPAPATPAAEAG